MEAPLPTGKLPKALLGELLDAQPGLPAEVRIGPRLGEDACAIDVEAGTLVVASDPITLTGSDVGRHAVVINANDVAVMGVRPRWFLAAVMFPEGSRPADVRALFSGMYGALASLDVALVGGHTEVTSAVVQPLVVGQMLGMSERGAVVSTGGARPGEVVVQVGAAPVEGAAVLASEARERLGGIANEMLDRAARAIDEPGICVVEPALRAAELGASSLHDPTEGGLASGLHEVAEAADLAIELFEDRVAWFEPGLAVCHALGADPWGTLASGTLLATFPADCSAAACTSLRDEGWLPREIGRTRIGAGVTRHDGTPLPTFPRDELARVLEELARTKTSPGESEGFAR